jgi:hypothetical protein
MLERQRNSAAARNFHEHHICPICGLRLCLCTIDQRREAMEQQPDELSEDWRGRLSLLEVRRLHALAI